MIPIPYFCRVDRRGCISCGSDRFQMNRVIDDQLAQCWELTHHERELLDEREGDHCANCGMSKRVRMLLWSIKRVVPEIRRLDVLHLNRTNGLTASLESARSLTETVYRPDYPAGEMVDGYANQDMAALTLEDNSFDLVIHSETLEHVHDYQRALSEARRVLKHGGYQVYTIPLLHRRTSRRRIAIDLSGRISHLLPPSFHGNEGEYPVVWEFGGDFLALRKPWIDQIHYDNYWRNPTIFTIIENKS